MTVGDPGKLEFAHWNSYSRFAHHVCSSNRYVWGKDEREFLQTVLATTRGRSVEIDGGDIFYRSQIGVDWEEKVNEDGAFVGEEAWGLSLSRMKPLKNRAKEGRANPSGIPVLYVSNSIETAISEARPWIGAEVSVATCKVLRPLKALDLSRGHGKHPFGTKISRYFSKNHTPEEKEKAVWVEIDNAFSKPVTRSDDQAEYAPTQILAELFRSAGYDAIGYKSHFGDGVEEKGYSIAIFDPNVVEIVSCTPYQVRSIKVEAERIGNPWYLKQP